MNRRTFLAATIAALITPLAAEAQQTVKLYTLAILSPHASPGERARVLVTDRLKELGWIEGQNIRIARAYGEEREDRLPELAEELTQRRVDVIWALGPSSAVAAARATTTIPIVFLGSELPG